MGRWQSWLSAVVMAVAAMVGTPALSQNLVTNPGFETNSLSGWTVEANSATGIANTTAHSGTYRATLGAFSSLAGINQTFATTAGQAYTFSFYVRGVGADGSGNRLQANFDGQTVYDTAALPNNGGVYFFQSFNRVATSGTTEISFRALNDSSVISLDDVSVQIAAAPELGTWALMIFGFGLIGATLRRRRHADARQALLLRA